MSKNRKHIIWKTILGLLLTGVLVASYILGSDKRDELSCGYIDVSIEDSLTLQYLTAEDIRQYISADYGTVTGLQVDKIDLLKIESILDGKDGVFNSEAYVTNTGTLKINIQQRKPIIQFKTVKSGFYCDEYGILIPLRDNFSCDVIVIDGYIPLDIEECKNGRPTDDDDIKWLDEILKIADLINSSELWKGRIAQIHHNESGEISIKVKDRKEEFLFGDLTCIKEKFDKMQIYYEMIVPAKEEKEYKVVDLKYNKQIVCK